MITTARWRPSRVQAKDGNLYWVFTLFGAGRGWYHRMHYVPLDDEYREIQVNVLPKFNTKLKKGVDVELLSNHNFDVVEFAKNPYVKKDGTFECKKMLMTGDNELWKQQMCKVYGVHHYTQKPTELKNYSYWPTELMEGLWYGKEVYDHIKDKDEVFIVEVEEKQLHAKV